jgi:hypothetical protein
MDVALANILFQSTGSHFEPVRHQTFRRQQFYAANVQYIQRQIRAEYGVSLSLNTIWDSTPDQLQSYLR